VKLTLLIGYSLTFIVEEKFFIELWGTIVELPLLLEKVLEVSLAEYSTR
jgi:hypothetical protein